MHDEDFRFLADPRNLEDALALRDLLSDFDGELRQRFIQVLEYAMRTVHGELRDRWELVVEENECGEVWFRPRVPGIVAGPIVGFDTVDPFIAPYWGIWSEDVRSRQKTAIIGCIRPLMDDPNEGEDYLLYENVPGFPRRNALESRLAIVEEKGAALTQRMAQMALRMAREMEKVF